MLFFASEAREQRREAASTRREAPRKKEPLVACIVNLISMQISYHISHQTGLALGGRPASVCFHYVTVYVTYDRTWRIGVTLGARVYFYSYFFWRAQRASEQRERRVNKARSAEKKITLECVTRYEN